MDERDYYVQYKPYILSTVKAKFPLVKRGHIILFDYQKREPKPRMVFVLTARWKGMMHCIKLNAIPYLHFQQLLKRFKSEAPEVVKDAIAEMRVPTDMSIRAPKRFYKTYFKPANAFKKYDPYRTYFIKGIKNVRLVDFDYGTMDDVEDPPVKGSELETEGKLI